MPGGLHGWTRSSWTNSNTKTGNVGGTQKHCLSIQGRSPES